MKRCGIRVLGLVAALFVIASVVSAVCISSGNGESAAFGPGITCINTEDTLPDDCAGSAQFPVGSTVAYKGKTYELEPGGLISVENYNLTITKGKIIKTGAGIRTGERNTAVCVRAPIVRT